MPASTLVTYDALLKRRFTARKIENLAFADRPLLAMMNKDPSFSGSAMSVPLIQVNPQGVAALDLATAQASKTNVLPRNFLITVGDYFGGVDIGSKVMLASRDNPGAFLSNKTAEMDGLTEQMADDLHIHLWGNGGGALGQRASAATNVITLVDKLSVYAFEVGMTIAASGDGDGSAGTENLRVGTTTVTSVDPENGTITLASAAAITSFANSDYLFREGDFFGATAARQGANIMKGVQAYIVASSASVPNLFGMVRTSNPIKLGGCRIAAADLTGRNAEERIKLLGARQTGAYKMKMATKGFMNPEDWANLEISLNSRGIRALKDESTRFGFMSLQVTSGGNTLDIVADRACPKGTYMQLRMENWKLWSMLDLIHTVNGDGLTLLRKSATNDYEFRAEAFPQVECNAPGYNGRVPV